MTFTLSTGERAALLPFIPWDASMYCTYAFASIVVRFLLDPPSDRQLTLYSSSSSFSPQSLSRAPNSSSLNFTITPCSQPPRPSSLYTIVYFENFLTLPPAVLPAPWVARVLAQRPGQFRPQLQYLISRCSQRSISFAMSSSPFSPLSAPRPL